MSQKTDNRYGIRAVAVSLKILETLVAAGESRGVSELARELDSTKARIYRHLETLRALGYVTQDDASGRYSVGHRLFLLAGLVRERYDLVRAVHPAVVALRDRTGQTAVFSAPIDSEVAILDLARGSGAVDIGLKLGTRFTAHATAQGKVSLACDRAFRDRCLSEPLHAVTNATITDREALTRELASIRERGWASAPEESILGLNAIAAPVVASNGQIAGAIAIIGALQFVPAQPRAEQIAEVCACARIASDALGNRQS